MTAEQKLTELGFNVLVQPTINMTEAEIRRQIESDSDIAAAVLNEVTRTHAPNPVNKENYCFHLDNWVRETAEAVHRDYTKRVVAPFKVIESLF